MSLKILIVIVLVVIIGSLASGFIFLIKDGGKSNRTVRALTVRIALSVLLFILLIAGYFTGAIQPHGLTP
jgi:hypothetical protein